MQKMTTLHDEDIENGKGTMRGLILFLSGLSSSLAFGLGAALFGVAGVVLLYTFAGWPLPVARWWSYTEMIIFFVLMTSWAVEIHRNQKTLFSTWLYRRSVPFKKGFLLGVVAHSAISFALLAETVWFYARPYVLNL